MKMCDRCRVSGCLLNYNGKECENARKEICPDVFYTNADHIRSMSDEELVDTVECQRRNRCAEVSKGFGSCGDCMLNWLKQPYKGGEVRC